MKENMYGLSSPSLFPSLRRMIYFYSVTSTLSFMTEAKVFFFFKEKDTIKVKNCFSLAALAETSQSIKVNISSISCWNIFETF